MMKKLMGAAGVALFASACGGGDAADEQSDETKGVAANEIVRPPLDPFPSTYQAYPGVPTLIAGATVLTGAGEKIENGAVLLVDGRIAGVGAAGSISAPEGATTIDAAGKWVTPGIIDIHSHLGVYPSPSMASTADGNEATSPNTAEVWAEHSVWPHDPGFTRALAGGVTALQILPGSANLFGGRSAILKNVPSRTVQGMKFPGAPYGMKMACGENPKRVYQNSGPSTRMANFSGYRKAWIDAAKYRDDWDEYWEKMETGGDEADGAKPPKRDLKLETLAGVLRGDIRVNMHCYRGDEMVQVLDMAEEFGYEIASFHHAIEGYKVADILAEKGVCAAVWSDWWGFKLEAYDAIRENTAFIHAQPNSCAVVHSDSEIGIQRLNQEAAKAMGDGRLAGVEISEEEAIAWITSNPAKAMGLDDQTGTLEAGKMADVVIWSRNPFSVYAQAEKVLIDGALLYDRADPALSPRTDFELGQLDADFTGGAGQ
ncbi:MAG: amidohydrolase [Pseudomonadota bacterium]